MDGQTGLICRQCQPHLQGGIQLCGLHAMARRMLEIIKNVSTDTAINFVMSKYDRQEIKDILECLKDQ